MLDPTLIKKLNYFFIKIGLKSHTHLMSDSTHLPTPSGQIDYLLSANSANVGWTSKKRGEKQKKKIPEFLSKALKSYLAIWKMTQYSK